ncbi:MAG TPA: carboxypeptidase-like regulatory domain-containing protein [Terriglobales bacterium]|nr:carboxypeptidase-like regulatory domain-containing protein [Terriglobales bacterium]
MRTQRWFILFLCLAMLALPLLVQAQGNSGGVTGAITDKTGAVVVNAEISLKDLATNRTLTAKSDEHGQYIVLQVPPGHYKMTVTAMNFSASVIPDLEINVGKTILTNITLQVGAVSEVVQVEATGAELQTVDASVGNVMSAQQLVAMPNLNRDATSLILFQPGAAPAPSPTADENTGSQIAGARSDQNTFMVDGGDATSNTDANSAYSNNFYATPRAAIPTPVESLEEFRVVTNNNAVGLGRSAGAEVQMVTKRGTNAFHGALYDYMIQNETNATAWQLKHDGIKNPEWRDSRFGARLGGPIWKDKTFFFVHWESRHFLQGTTSNATRWAPQQSILNGLLGYKAYTDPVNKTGSVIKYINPATQDCEGRPAAPPNTCDPLGLGLNPTIANIWNQMPRPNTGTGGDGVNFLNFTGAGAVHTNEEFGVIRLDHQINQKWHAMASYRYGVTEQTTTNQVTFNPDGSLVARANRPIQPRYVVFGLTGQLSNNVTNDLHLGYLRHFWQWGTMGAQPQVAGLGGAMQLVNEAIGSGVVPTNVDTQQARQRNWNGKDWNLIDNMTWLRGSHLFQFGGHYGWQRLVHTRDDIVTYALADPVYYSLWNTAHGNVKIPLPCALDSGGNCLTDSSGNTISDAVSSAAFRSAYTAMMGIVEEANQVRVRDASLGLKPAGTRLNNHTAMGNWEIHFADTWRIKPSFSLTWGLGWGVQMPPFEQNGLQTMMVINGIPFSMDQYLNTKKQYALQGRAYNPVIGFTPIENTGRKYAFDPDYTNLSPRLAFAWNPEFKDSILGRLFGDKHTVFRGGWTRVYDRMTGVDLVMTPTLGVGFGQTASCIGPLAAGGCAGVVTTTTGATPATAFRIGVNGNSVAIPDPPPVTAPIEPGIGGYPYVTRDYHIDPRRQVGSADVFDLSIQRELPARMILEVGFIGRRARDLYQKIDTNQIPYMYTMGGQTFAQAYDATQTAIVGGGTPAVQPFWEASLGGTASHYCSHDAKDVPTAYASCTAAVVAKEGGSFAIRDVYSVFTDLDTEWVSGSFMPYTTQYTGSDVTASRGRSNYAALFFSLRKAMSRGLQFDANYTLSKSMDSFGWNQDIIDSMMDAYYPDRSYGPSQFDRRHAFNFVATYELPFGRGKSFSSSSNVIDKIIGGWSTSWIFTAASGTPIQIYNSDSGLEFGDGSGYVDSSSMVPINPGKSFIASRHDSVTIGSNGYGSDSDKGPFQGGYPNIFANPDAVAAGFRLPLFSDPRAGYFNGLRGLGRWNVDMSLGKTTKITERLSTRFEVQMVNAFNHPELSDNGPSAALDIATPSSFGVLSTQYNRPRFIQWGLRFDF